MKSKLDPTTTPEEKFAAFQDGLRRILTVSKKTLAKREAEYQAERATKPKRGPKPHHSSASDRASDSEN